MAIAGRAIPVTGAWVVVAPPNYGTKVIGWRTLYDLLVDTYVEAGWMPFPTAISSPSTSCRSFAGFRTCHGSIRVLPPCSASGAPLDFADPALLAKLARPRDASGSDPYAELRRRIAGAFRPDDSKVNEPRLWPWIYGDAYGSFGEDSPRNNLALGNVQMALLNQWAAGSFVNDWDPDASPPGRLKDLPLAAQPEMLDRSALHFCLADAFHPGCELTWPMRHASLYQAPFRIRRRAAGELEPDDGSELTPETALKAGGPLYAQGPGTLSRWMGLPWQGDTAFCRSGYEPDFDPYLPTFWAARVPNQVLTQADYEIVIDTARPREERLAAFMRRQKWLRSLKGDVPTRCSR